MREPLTRPRLGGPRNSEQAVRNLSRRCDYLQDQINALTKRMADIQPRRGRPPKTTPEAKDTD